MSEARSVVTCDLEGRIETFNRGAVEIFGYDPEEVIGRKRVSLFSPGLVVLEHVPRWLKEARASRRFETRTVFVRKDGTRFAADIRITPTFKRGEQIGYCGVTMPCPDVRPEDAEPPISVWTRLVAALVITRAPFLAATIVPILVAAASLIHDRGIDALSHGLLALSVFGATALHLAANTLNDYFDHESGTDQDNNDYFQALSGGSRAIELGLVRPRTLLTIAGASLVAALAAGVAAASISTPLVWAFGAIGGFAAYFYTAPPLRLVARKGLGELFVGLCFGPLMVAGARAVLEGGLTGATLGRSLLLGVPPGLLTTAILWINEFPDAESDAATGKRNLVVVLGRRAARWGYALLFALAFGVLAVGAASGWLPRGAAAGLLGVPLALYAAFVAWHHYEDRSLVRANQATIVLQILVGLLMAAGLWMDAPSGP